MQPASAALVEAGFDFSGNLQFSRNGPPKTGSQSEPHAVGWLEKEKERPMNTIKAAQQPSAAERNEHVGSYL